jgi:hypothetical protein
LLERLRQLHPKWNSTRSAWPAEEPPTPIASGWPQHDRQFRQGEPAHGTPNKALQLEIALEKKLSGIALEVVKSISSSLGRAFLHESGKKVGLLEPLFKSRPHLTPAESPTGDPWTLENTEARGQLQLSEFAASNAILENRQV